MAQQAQEQFRYQRVQLIKTELLGTGSYGAVYKARCDDLLCAGKILHPTLFQSSDPGAMTVMVRFQQECNVLRAIRHPNIVQYLESYQDPETRLPVLLMELMDDSLTQFLERSQAPLPYHTQVNISHDIALALSYLHSNDIIHRDLSSNNVLLIGVGNRAKVTDFGMAKLFDTNRSTMTPQTMCPGTQAYMSPEALDDPPVYTKKLDTFSFGVLGIQIITRKFPNPDPRTKKVRDPRDPKRRLQEVVPEAERRNSHICLINPAHPLLPMATACLSYNEEDRPSAQELCHRLAALKETPQYDDSVQHAQSVIAEREDRERKLLQEKEKYFQQQLQVRDSQAQEKDVVIAARQQEIQQLRQENKRITQEKEKVILEKKNRERELLDLDYELTQQRAVNETVTAQFQEKEKQLKQQVIQQKEHDIEALKLKLESSEDINSQFQQNLLKKDEMIQELKEEKVKLQQQKDKLWQAKEELQKVDEKLQLETRRLRQELGQQQQEVKKIQEENQCLQKKLRKEKEFSQTILEDNQARENQLQKRLAATSNELKEKEQEIMELQGLNQQLANRESELQQQQGKCDEQIYDLQQKLHVSEQQIQKMTWDKNHAIRQLRELKQQLADCEQETAKFKQNLQQKEEKIHKLQEDNKQLQEKLQEKDKILQQKLTLRWKTCKPAPCSMLRGSAAVCGNMAYFRPHDSKQVLSYNSDTEEWSTLPECPTYHFTLTVVNGLVTAVGGSDGALRIIEKLTNTLLSLVENGGRWKWEDRLKPMPTKRKLAAVVCSGKTLVVAGGKGEGALTFTTLNKVEVMNTDTLQWSRASNLPQPLYDATATVCGGRVYLGGAMDESGNHTKSVFTCSLNTLLQSQKTRNHTVWHTIGDPQVECFTCVTLNGQLLAVGGWDLHNRITSNTVYSYNVETKSFEFISQMPTCRQHCLVAVLPGNKVMVVGGQNRFGHKDEVEIAILQ